MPPNNTQLAHTVKTAKDLEQALVVPQVLHHNATAVVTIEVEPSYRQANVNNEELDVRVIIVERVYEIVALVGHIQGPDRTHSNRCHSQDTVNQTTRSVSKGIQGKGGIPASREKKEAQGQGGHTG